MPHSNATLKSTRKATAAQIRTESILRIFAISDFRFLISDLRVRINQKSEI
jgi:hypothetical protein